MGRLPNVLYIGLQKSGSTFLRHYFWSHASIYCDRHAMFFQTDAADTSARDVAVVRADYARLFEERPPRPCRIDMYESIGMGYVFRNGATWQGERFVSPEETLETGPAEAAPEKLARRVKDVLPDAKILMTVRSQVSWLDSSYRHFLAHLPAHRRQFADFLATPEGKLSLDAAQFDRTVALYDRLFGAENVHVLPLEMIEREESEALRRLVKFLDVPFMPYEAKQKNFNRGNPAPPAAPPRRSLADRLLGRGAQPDGPISDAEMRVIWSAFAAGNTRLAQRIGLDLQKLGYPL